MVVMVVAAIVFAAAVYGRVTGALPIGVGAPSPTVAVTATPSPTPSGPTIAITHDPCCSQTARFLNAAWTSTQPVSAVTLTVDPAPPFGCSATVDASGLRGTFGCAGFLPGATDHVAHLVFVSGTGTYPVAHAFRTMGDRLENVRWFTEFEDPNADPLNCASASIRIVQLFAGGEDKMTATQIQDFGHQFNVSGDPGLDPAAIATTLKRLDARDSYHYYRFATREEATASAAYWLIRSGKPVIAITLAGQHAPVVMGFQGAYGTYYDDPNNRIVGVVVQDPQRGEMRPETLDHRPDKYRTPEFQTGRLLLLDEWYGDEWWFGFAYAGTITYAGKTYEVDRSDGAYPSPHWAGKFVLVVDDGDAEWPSNKEGRVKWH